MRPELSIVLPCLNEAHTIRQTIERTLAVCRTLDLTWEILIVDNGSIDESREIIQQYPEVQLLECPHRGVGNTLRYGLDRAQGTYLVFYDTDLSYLPEELPLLLAHRMDADMVIGSRLTGTIEEGAMPWLHRYVGTPFLTFLQNICFRLRTTDCNSGYRLISKVAYDRLALTTSGMEFVSEMAIKSGILGLRIRELPITYAKDQRPGRSHLRTFRDGWRHLRLILMYMPYYAFALPGFFLLLLGIFLVILQLPPVAAIIGYTYGFHVAMLGGASFFLGLQLLFFYLCTHLLTYNATFFPNERWFPRIAVLLQHPRIILLSSLLIVLGFGINVCVLWYWIQNNFGPMNLGFSVIFGFQLLTLGMQLGFSSLFASFISFSRANGHIA